MHDGQDDRLDAVTRDLHAFLEQQLGDLLGVVRAAETLARQVKALDDEAERKHALHAHLSGQGSHEHAALIEAEIVGLEAVRAEYVDQLTELASGLHV